jgi:hypothetical protein
MPLTDEGVLESIRLTPTQRTRLVKQLREHYDQGVAARGDWPTRHDDHYRRFLADWTLRPQGPWPGAPRLFTSHTRRTMEKIHGDLWKACFPGFEAIHLDPVSDETLERYPKATQVERWTLRYAVNDADQGGWMHIGKMALFDALLDSTGFLKVYPWRLPWKHAVPDTMVRIDNVDEGTLLIPPGVTGLQYPAAEFVGQELWPRWDELVRKRSQGFRVPPKTKLKPEMRPLTERERTEAEREGHQVPEEREGYKTVEMYERFVLGDPDDDPEDDLVVSWYPDADDEDCLARVLYITDLFPNQPHPLRPFFTLTVWPQPRQLRGLSVAERTRTPQDMLNRLAEQTINYGDVSILPFYFYNALITGDLPDLRQVMPGQGVPVNDIGGVQFAPRSSLNRHFMEQGQAWGAEIEADLHVSDISLGRQPMRPNAPRTLGGTQLLIQQGREAFSDLVEHLGAQYSAVLDFHWRLWQFFIPPGLKIPTRRAMRGTTPTPLPSHGPLFDDMQPFALPPPPNGAPGGAPGGGMPALAGLLGPGAPPGPPGLPPGMDLGAGAPPEMPPGMDLGGAPPLGQEMGPLAAMAAPNGMNGFSSGQPPPAPMDLPRSEIPGVEGLLEPDTELLLAEEIHKEDIAGEYNMRVVMSPDLPYDRQVIMQLGQFMLPVVLERYPIGARLLLKRMWELNGQRAFDQIYPPAIALLETQRLFTRVLMEQQLAQAQMQAAMQPQQPPPPEGEPPPSPETQAILEAGEQHRMHHEANMRELEAKQATEAAEHDSAMRQLDTQSAMDKALHEARMRQAEYQSTVTEAQHAVAMQDADEDAAAREASAETETQRLETQRNQARVQAERARARQAARPRPSPRDRKPGSYVVPPGRQVA